MVADAKRREPTHRRTQTETSNLLRSSFRLGGAFVPDQREVLRMYWPGRDMPSPQSASTRFEMNVLYVFHGTAP